jgi:plasmid stability protein
MPEVLVHDLDEDVIEQLKVRARGNGRSLQAELKRILEQAAQSDTTRMSRASYRVLADQIRAALAGHPQGDSTALLAEDRAR